MSQSLDLGSIEHLDFKVEEEKKEEKSHWTDPIDWNKHWCGETATGNSPWSNNSRTKEVGEVTCISCLRLYIEKGRDWWWTVHRTYFQSNCSPGNHNCLR